MYPAFSFRLCAALVLLAFAGCVHTKSPPRPLRVAIAITPVGVASLSTAQTAHIHAALKPQVEQRGFVFAEISAAADLVLLVKFTPTPGSAGGHVQIMGIQPTTQFRRETNSGDTPEAQEMRRRQRELEQWVERQGRLGDSS